MKALYDLKDKLCMELDEIAGKPDLSAGDLETVHKLTDTIKNIDKIAMLESDGGYSRAGGWEARGTYGGHAYDDGGSSYTRRGTHYVRGHYSRDDGRMYSRDDGKARMESELEDMMRSADGEQREILRRALEEIRK